MLDESHDEVQRGTAVTFTSTQPRFPSFTQSRVTTDSTDNLGSVSMPSYSESVASTTSTQAAGPYYITTPKPDITVGLADTAFILNHQRLLVDHQAAGSTISDPHAAEIGIRFPFLIVESKGWSSKGTLISAQNQAAVGGACMLKILKDLSYQAMRGPGTDLKSDLAEQSTTLIEPSSMPALCFFHRERGACI